MRVPWRSQLVQALDEAIKQLVRARWPSTPEDYTKPRQDFEHQRSFINFLHPAPAPDRSDWNGSGHHGDPRFYVPRDLMLIDRCDLLVSYIGTTGRNLGGAGEIGYAYARGRRIITIDENPGHQSYDSWRVMSTSIFENVRECAGFLIFLTNDDLHVPYTVLDGATLPLTLEDRNEVLSR
jgi:hypothetical protein